MPHDHLLPRVVSHGLPCLVALVCILLLTGCGSIYHLHVSTPARTQATATFDATVQRFSGQKELVPPSKTASNVRYYSFSFRADATAAVTGNGEFELVLNQRGYWTEFSDRLQYRRFVSALRKDFSTAFGRQNVTVQHRYYYDPDPMNLFGIFPVAP